MPQIFVNNAKATLASEISAAATALPLEAGKGALFASPTASDWLKVTLDDGVNVEICLVNGRSGDSLTPVVRAQEGTTARVWPAGTVVEARLTKATMDRFPQPDRRLGLVSLNSQVTFERTAGGLIGALMQYTNDTNISSGVWVNDSGVLTHQAPSVYSMMLSLKPGIGVYLYTSSNSSASWNTANGKQLFDIYGALRSSVGFACAPVLGETFTSLDAFSLPVLAGSPDLLTDFLAHNPPQIQERTTDGTTWTPETVTDTLFTGQFKTSGPVVLTNAVHRGVRWTWTALPYIMLARLQAYITTQGNTAVMMVEQSADGTNWTTAATTTSIASWPGVATHGMNLTTSGKPYLRITLTPTWAHAFHAISIYNLRCSGFYSPDVAYRLWTQNVDRSMIFHGPWLQVGGPSGKKVALAGGTTQYPIISTYDCNAQATVNDPLFLSNTGRQNAPSWAAASWGYLWTSAGGDVASRGIQFFGDVNNLGWRERSNGAWKQIVDSGNISGFTAGAATRTDTSGAYVWTTATAASAYPKGILTSFVRPEDGWPSYGSVMHLNAYPSGGGGAVQLYVPYGNGVNAGQGLLRYRFADYTASPSAPPWTAWRTIWDSNSFDPALKANLAGPSFTGVVSAAGHSTSWGNTPTAGFRTIMGTGFGATWLCYGTSDGAFRGGVQLLDSATATNMRLYAGANYLQFGASGLFFGTNDVWHAGNFNPTTFFPNRQTYVSTANVGTDVYVRVGQVALSEANKDVMVTVRAVTAAGTVTEVQVQIAFAWRSDNNAGMQPAIFANTAHSYNSDTTAENGFVLRYLRLSWDSSAGYAYLDMNKYVAGDITITVSPLTPSAWTWATGTITAAATSGATGNLTLYLQYGQNGNYIQASNSPIATYCNYGVLLGATGSDTSDKTGKWVNFGYFLFSRNSTYRFGHSIETSVRLVELSDDGSVMLEDFIVHLRAAMPVFADSTAFNAAVPSLSVEVEGNTSLTGADFAILVHAGSTDTKTIRAYVKLAKPNSHYDIIPVSRYGRAYNSSKTFSTSYTVFYGVVNGAAAALPTPYQGSVVYGAIRQVKLAQIPQGPNSTLDADTLDGLEASDLAAADAINQDANAITKSGLYHCSSNVPSSTGDTDKAVIHTEYSQGTPGWATQIAQSFRENRMWVRRKTNTVWSDWTEVTVGPKKVKSPVYFYYETELATTDKQPAIRVSAASTIVAVRTFRDNTTYPTQNATIYIKKNGTTVYTLTVPTSDAHQTFVTRSTTETSLAAGDVLTAEVYSAGAGHRNMTIQLDIDQPVWS